MNYLDLVVFIIGVVFVAFSQVVQTKNFMSSVVFKVLPTLSGLYLLWYTGYHLKLFG